VARYVETSEPDDLRAEIRDYIVATRATRAVLDDIAAVVEPWPFTLGALAARVEIWHGGSDPAVPVSFARSLAAELPNARLHLFADEGHFVFHTHGDEVIASIRRHAVSLSGVRKNS
jgi:pimeloyl-ACP methyl ester carboxylesterase